MRRNTVLKPLPSEDDQAARFVRQREADRTAVAEDYVELIADLLCAEGEARAVDLARRMGVSQATVANTITRLQRDGLVETRPYRGLFLTEAGVPHRGRGRTRHTGEGAARARRALPHRGRP